MVATYADAGIAAYAAWVHESDARDGRGADRSRLRPPGDDLGDGAGTLDSSRPPTSGASTSIGPARGTTTSASSSSRPGCWPTPTRPTSTWSIGRRDGEAVATGMAYDHDGDCGIYNVATLEPARRQGLGGGVVEMLVHDAATRGCTTATLQSTEMARGVYAGQGFRDLGRILELGPR